MGINIKTTPDEIVKGATFNRLANSFAKVMKRNKEGLEDLGLYMNDVFGVKAYFAIAPESNYDLKFYGFRAYPMVVEGRWLNDWRNIEEWYIELDNRLINDYSNRLTPVDISILFLWYVQGIMANVELTNRIKLAIETVFHADKMDWRMYRIFKGSPSVANIANILLVYRCYWKNFPSQLDSTTLVGANTSEHNLYQNAVKKLAMAYGTSELVDRPIEDFDRGVNGLVYTMYESINDLKYSAFRFRKNLMSIIKTTGSPYGQKILLNTYRAFTDRVGKVFVQEQNMTFAQPKEKTTEMIAAENVNIDAYWKKHISKVLESIDVKFIDRNGYALKCPKLDVDELLVQVTDIDSTDDKIFMLEKIHEKLAIIDNALAMLADRDTRSKVKQTKTELESLRSQLELIRDKVFKAPVGPTHYGLFIKYPAGYEG